MGAKDHAQRLTAPADREALSRDMSKLREPRSGTRAYGRGRRLQSQRSSGDASGAGDPAARKPGFRISRAGWATLAAILISAVIWAAVVAAILFVRHNFVVQGG